MPFKSPSRSTSRGSTSTGKLFGHRDLKRLMSSVDLPRGCVTPAQIDNLIETSGGDTDMVDGYDELPAEYQEKVKFALENGHVPDDDWKGVSPCNSHGSRATTDYIGPRSQS
jgi:hypothetical protein